MLIWQLVSFHPNLVCYGTDKYMILLHLLQSLPLSLQYTVVENHQEGL